MRALPVPFRGVVEQLEVLDPRKVTESVLSEDSDHDVLREVGLVEVDGLYLSVHDHRLHVVLRVDVVLLLGEESAEDLESGRGDRQATGRHQHARGCGEGRRQLVLVAEVLVRGRRVDLDGAPVGKHREIAARRADVRAGAVLDVDDQPTRLPFRAATVERQSLCALGIAVRVPSTP